MYSVCEGVIALTRHPTEPEVWISQVLAVAHAHRRQYIGFTLKLTALATTFDSGAELLSSEVDLANSAMRRCNELFEAETAPEETDPDTLITVVRPSS